MASKELIAVVELGEEIVRRLKTLGEPEENTDGKGWIIDTFLDHGDKTVTDTIHLYESDFAELVALARLGLIAHQNDRKEP